MNSSPNSTISSSPSSSLPSSQQEPSTKNTTNITSSETILENKNNQDEYNNSNYNDSTSQENESHTLNSLLNQSLQKIPEPTKTSNEVTAPLSRTSSLSSDIEDEEYHALFQKHEDDQPAPWMAIEVQPGRTVQDLWDCRCGTPLLWRLGYLSVDSMIMFGLWHGFQDNNYLRLVLITYPTFTDTEQLLHTTESVFERELDRAQGLGGVATDIVVTMTAHFMKSLVSECADVFDRRLVEDTFSFMSRLVNMVDPSSAIHPKLVDACETLSKAFTPASAHAAGDEIETSSPQGSPSLHIKTPHTSSPSLPSAEPSSPSSPRPKTWRRAAQFSIRVMKHFKRGDSTPRDGATTDSDEDTQDTGTPRTLDPASIMHSMNQPDVADIKNIRFDDLDAKELGRQMTLVEHELFCRIGIDELLAMGWMKDGREWEAPNITALISRANSVTSWVQSMILSCSSTRKRRNVLRKFIAIAEECVSLCNYNSAFELAGGLSSGPVNRLKQTWGMLSKNERSRFRSLQKLCTFANNHSNYRAALQKINDQPCIPYLGVWLKDLVFMDDGNPDVRWQPLGEDEDAPVEQQINVTKKAMQADMLERFRAAQRSMYNYIETNTRVQNYLWWQINFNVVVNDDTLYSLSKGLE
eukprot:gb/GECH01009023.1/.p1 GENE.gb/GECH01009023.1/~~gb/GECH01009023.1/.p1  ORF type:complete len:638 (+),score=140.77 gb/GECH01009023.1/:1-1914(+)